MSYRADTVEKDLGAAVHNRLTGHFKDSYNALTHELVIPEARRQHISSVANVPAAACVSATADHAVVLVFVDQIVTVGQDHPTSAASRVRVTLDKIGGAWLISDFTPL
jgi:Mce-associated membrane protein